MRKRGGERTKEEGVRKPLGFYSFTGKRTERGSLSPNQNWKMDDTKKKFS